jgi:quinol monooxygenase YgiN
MGEVIMCATRRLWMFLGLLAALTLAASPAGLAADPAAQDKPKDKAGGSQDLFTGLLTALRNSPGCLGIEVARTESGKEVVFAWFEDKKAALAWYNSDAHREMMKKFFGLKPRANALADVPDDAGPIMAVASVTLGGPPTKDNPLPYKQISIELYRPLSGGLSFGGRFAPDKLKLPKPTAKPETAKPEK